MHLESRIYIAGHRGLVGSAILRELTRLGYTNLLTRPHSELELRDAVATRRFFADTMPEYVFLAAARVGGILANQTYPADFLRDNLEIQNNVIDASYQAGVRRLLFLGSSCIYPKFCPQPIREEYLLTGPLEPANRPYALAKIAGIEMCRSYNRQYNREHGAGFLAAMPTNLYGPNDNFDPQDSHVLPALMRKVYQAKLSGAREITVWGTGTPRRELLYSDDMAEACIFLLNLPGELYESLLSENDPPLVNIGAGSDISIRELAELLRDLLGCDAELRFDPTKPDGTPRKLLDVSKLAGLGWTARTPLVQGIQKTFAAARQMLAPRETYRV